MKTRIAIIALALVLSAFGQDKATKGTTSITWNQVPYDSERYVQAVYVIVTGETDPTRKFKLLWKDNAKASNGYRIERSTNAEDFVKHAEVPAHVTSFEEVGLPAGVYIYRIKAVASS